MRDKTVSRTALGVATTMLTLSQKEGWPERLPDGLADTTEILVKKAGIPGFGTFAISRAKTKRAIRRFSRFERLVPGVFEGLGRRKIFMQEQLDQALRDGFDQVAVIGAGFDALCIRSAPKHRNVRFIEVDHPATQSAKKKGLQALGAPSNLTLAAADLSETRLADVLLQLAEDGKWNPEARSLFIAEGLFMYLTRDQVLDVFKQVENASGKGSRLAFSHLNSLRQHHLTRAAVAMIGEPWRSASQQDKLTRYIGKNWRVFDQAPLWSRRDLEGYAVAEYV